MAWVLGSSTFVAVFPLIVDMKLLIIFPSQTRGGTEEYALTIASAAVKEGWEVHAAFPQTADTTSLINDFTMNGVCYHQLKIAEPHNWKLKTRIKYFLRFIRTIALLRRIKPDIVQVNLPWPDQCLYSILACGLFRIPTVIVLHLIPSQWSFKKLKLMAYTWARARNQQWIAISENNRRLICKSFHIPHDQVIRIYNGVKLMVNSNPIDYGESMKFRHQVRQELDVPETSRLILTVGRLAPHKGYSDLVPVIPHIVREFPDVRFIWAGTGEQGDYLLNKVRGYGVEKYVILLGYRTDVPKLLYASDLFVFPTHFEGLPFILIEAMAHGLPIVASDASSIPEVIKDKAHGLLFRSGDSCDLMETIRWALRNPEDMRKMAQRAALRVREFSEEEMVEETLTVLRSHADIKQI